MMSYFLHLRPVLASWYCLQNAAFYFWKETHPLFWSISSIDQLSRSRFLPSEVGQLARPHLVCPKLGKTAVGVLTITRKCWHYPWFPLSWSTNASKLPFMRLGDSVWKLSKTVVETADEFELRGHIESTRLIDFPHGFDSPANNFHVLTWFKWIITCLVVFASCYWRFSLILDINSTLIIKTSTIIAILQF